MTTAKKAIIRQMRIDDIPAVYRLGEKFFTSEEYPTLYRTWDPFEVTEYFSSDPDYCLVAELRGTIVGFALATTVEKKRTAWKKYGYLAWILIDDEHQQHGDDQRRGQGDGEHAAGGAGVAGGQITLDGHLVRSGGA
ncbi:MAG: GNAT family N-acetyltransferase, partial [Dehalococcoidia bacterium]